MLIDMNYIFFSFLLVAYSTWLFVKRKEKASALLILCFAFLTLSILLQLLSSSWWNYTTLQRIHPRIFELAGLASFASFAITAILALTKLSKPRAGSTT